MNELRSGRSARIAIAVAGAAALFVGGWALGHASPSSPWARSGVRAARPQIEPLEDPRSTALDVNPGGPKDDASSVAADDDAEGEGDSVSDLLAEAAARAKLGFANDAGSAAPAPAPIASASVAPAPSAPLGSATRMRHVAEQIIVTCRSGHAEDVRVLADALLEQHPPPWLAQRVRAACGIEDPGSAPP